MMVIFLSKVNKSPLRSIYREFPRIFVSIDAVPLLVPLQFLFVECHNTFAQLFLYVLMLHGNFYFVEVIHRKLFLLLSLWDLGLQSASKANISREVLSSGKLHRQGTGG